MKYILFLSLIFTQMACLDRKDCHKGIDCLNNSKNDIYILDDCDTSLLHYGGSPRITGRDYKVESGQNQGVLSARTGCIESYVNYCPNQKISLFIIDGYTLENVPWDTIRFKNKYLRRETLSVADLNNRNWTITYP
jgi:hypothetical protein